MAVTTEIKLAFLTDRNKVVTFTVKEPNTSLNRADIQNAMDDMMISGVASKTSGSLDSYKYAKLITTDVTDITLP